MASPVENSCRSFEDRDSQQRYYMRVNFRGDSAAKDFESTARLTVQITDVESAWQAGRCLLLSSTWQCSVLQMLRMLPQSFLPGCRCAAAAWSARGLQMDAACQDLSGWP